MYKVQSSLSTQVFNTYYTLHFSLLLRTLWVGYLYFYYYIPLYSLKISKVWMINVTMITNGIVMFPTQRKALDEVIIILYIVNGLSNYIWLDLFTYVYMFTGCIHKFSNYLRHLKSQDINYQISDSKEIKNSFTRFQDNTL